MGLRLTKAELARALDVSGNTVGAWLKRGCPALEHGRPGKPYVFDLAAVVSWLTDRPNAAGTDEEAEASAGYRAERARLVAVRRKAAELELAKAEKALVPRGHAKRMIQETAQAARKAWEQWPTRVYAEMAAALGVDSARLHQVLDEHVHRQLVQVGRAPVDGNAGVLLDAGRPNEDDEPEGEDDDDNEA